MADLFKEIIPSITKTKKYVLENENDYVPFLVNRSLSNYDDCLFQSNEMNMLYHLDKKLQYDYFINIIRAKSRSFAKWHKPMKEDDLESVKIFYGYSNVKAKEALRVLTDDQIAMIRKITTIGD